MHEWGESWKISPATANISKKSHHSFGLAHRTNSFAAKHELRLGLTKIMRAANPSSHAGIVVPMSDGYQEHLGCSFMEGWCLHE